MAYVTEKIFDPGTIDDTAYTLTQHMPQGEAWEAKGIEGTNLNGLVYACARPHHIFKELVNYVQSQLDASKTTDLIDEWEKSVGLPDACTGPITNIVERRVAVIQRFSRMPIVTLGEMQEYVNNYLDGITVKLYPGRTYYGLQYKLPQRLLGNVNSRFIIVVEVDRGASSLQYSLQQKLIRSIDVSVIQCILRKIVPANVLIKIELRS